MRKERESKKERLEIASLVLGICSIVFSWLGIIGLATGIIAVVLSSIQKKKYGKSDLATAGMITGIIGMVLSSFIVIMVIISAIIAGTALKLTLLGLGIFF